MGFHAMVYKSIKPPSVVRSSTQLSKVFSWKRPCSNRTPLYHKIREHQHITSSHRESHAVMAPCSLLENEPCLRETGWRWSRLEIVRWTKAHNSRPSIPTSARFYSCAAHHTLSEDIIVPRPVSPASQPAMHVQTDLVLSTRASRQFAYIVRRRSSVRPSHGVLQTSICFAA